MSAQNKKIAVLYQLNQELSSVSLNELLKKLGSGYSERSVRRWLAEMVAEGLVKKLGDRRSTRYKVVENASQRLGTAATPFRIESKEILENVRRPLYERVPIAYADNWFHEYQPNVNFYIPLDIRLQLHKAGKRSKIEDPAGTYAHQIFNRLLIDLSYNSSRLEGNTYSLLDTQKLLLEGASAEGKLDEEAVMILNHKEAIRYLVNSAPTLEINRKTICTLHFLLSDGLVEPCYAGKVRDHGVRIGGSTYIPFEDPQQLQLRLDRIAQKAVSIEDPYEQSLFLLIHLTYLQAFSDVNKRTARLSANIPLIKHNLVPLSFNDVEKDDYTSAVIAIYELQNIGPLLDLYLFSYMRTCSMYDSKVKAIGFDEIRVRYRQQRRALIREILLKGKVGKVLDKYILSQAEKLVKKEDRSSFIIDTEEDLREIDVSRIVGLGVTEAQLKKWKKSYTRVD